MFETFYVGPSSQAFSTGSSGIAWFAGYVSKNKSHKVRHVDDGYEEVLNLFSEWAWCIVKHHGEPRAEAQGEAEVDAEADKEPEPEAQVAAEPQADAGLAARDELEPEGADRNFDSPRCLITNSVAPVSLSSL